MNELALFAGAGGGILGGHLLGWRTVCAVEWEAYPASVLVQRQNDGTLPAFPIWDDVQTFDGKPWRGRIDVVSGGFPCQDISCAGKGAGIEGDRSSMWKHMARIIGEVRPRYAYVENSPMLVGRGLATVLSDLAEMGYDAKWGIMGAHHVAAPHKRDRIWVVATDTRINGRNSGRNIERENRNNTTQVWEVAEDQQQRGERVDRSGEARKDVSDAISKRGCCGDTKWEDAINAWKSSRGEGDEARGVGWWDAEPDVGRVAHGVASRVDRLKAIGNGQVPQVAALAWNILNEK